MIEKVTALTATQNEPEKIDPEEQLPDLPGPELPDLTRLYKRRCRDGNVMQRCKHMLIAGYSPGRVALLLYTVVMSLRQNGVTESAINARMPPYDDPLYVEYRRVCERKSVSKSRPIQINPVRRSQTASGTA